MSSPKLSPKELRERRLKALSGQATNDESDDEDLQAALALSLETTTFDISQFHQIMWDQTMTTENDQNRWVGQGIHTVQGTAEIAKSEETKLEQLVSSHQPWGLQQQHGGPCGVLAAVQAEMLRCLLFAELDVKQAMASAIATILARVTLTRPANEKLVYNPTETVIVLSEKPLEREDLVPWTTGEQPPSNSNLVFHTLTVESKTHDPAKRPKMEELSSAEKIEALSERIRELIAPRLEAFEHPGGVLLLVMSCVASRGANLIRNEFDDPSSRLTAQFGHCSQELMNLLLTGQAVSNVFDNTMNMSEEMALRGIQSQPSIGYLTQLEALRYCEVGTFYKSPKYPIWVVGSTSHFTVLFGDMNAMKESKSDLVLDECRRAFKSFDSDNGFIQTSDLGKVLEHCNISLTESEVSIFCASVEVAGAGIILWDDFWKIASRLKTGASLETVLQGNDNEVQIVEMPKDTADAKPTARIGGFFDKPLTTPAAGEWLQESIHETDEQIARRLAAEWGDQDGMAALSEAAHAIEQPAMTDEEYARKLQADIDAEMSATNSVSAVNGSPSRPSSPEVEFSDLPPLEIASELGDSKPAAKSNVFEFEKFGDTFPLYHYNGLRGGTLTPFRVTRLSPEEAVGESIALNRNAHGGGGGGDLEDVVRTKWPSCAVNWLGKASPYID